MPMRRYSEAMQLCLGVALHTNYTQHGPVAVTLGSQRVFCADTTVTIKPKAACC